MVEFGDSFAAEVDHGERELTRRLSSRGQVRCPPDNVLTELRRCRSLIRPTELDLCVDVAGVEQVFGIASVLSRLNSRSGIAL